jgi:hypothetical protein
VLCLVECGGIVLHNSDKLVCTERTILARMDAEPLLRYYARQQALSVVHLWDAPQVVLDYLMGDDAALAAAGAAAWAAARDDVVDVVNRAAARAVAWAAVWSPATYAARAAVADAAWAAAGNSARAVARHEFNDLVRESFADFLEVQ